jgi:hypothetical protein
VERIADLAGLLIVPARTPTLEREVAERGLAWTDLGGGYTELRGGVFRLLVVEMEAVARLWDDDLLRLFTKEEAHTQEARRFWAEQVGAKEAMMAEHELEDYDEVLRRFLKQVPPEMRTEGLDPEQRAAGLTPEQRLLLVPDDLLRILTAGGVDELPEPTRSIVRKRLGH